MTARRSRTADCEHQLANLLRNYGEPTFVTRSDAEAGARLFLTLVDLGAAGLQQLNRETAISKTKISACMTALRDNGLITKGTLKASDKRKMEGEKALYQAPGNPSEAVQSWADRLKQTRDSFYERDLDKVVASLKPIPEPVVMFETVVSSREPLGDAAYEHSVAQTIRLIRGARTSVKILTRDFSWIDEALPTIEAVKKQSDDVAVKFLVCWNLLLKEGDKGRLKGLEHSYKNVEIRELLKPDVFRFTIVDDATAYVVKRSIEEKRVEVEGAFRVLDADFVRAILCAYFDSIWDVSGPV